MNLLGVRSFAAKDRVLALFNKLNADSHQLGRIDGEPILNLLPEQTVRI